MTPVARRQRAVGLGGLARMRAVLGVLLLCSSLARAWSGVVETGRKSRVELQVRRGAAVGVDTAQNAGGFAGYMRH